MMPEDNLLVIYIKVSKAKSSVVIVIVGLISRFLKRYSKAKRTRAPAYSRALRRIKGASKGGKEKLGSDFQSTRRGQSYIYQYQYQYQFRLLVSSKKIYI